MSLEADDEIYKHYRDLAYSVVTEVVRDYRRLYRAYLKGKIDKDFVITERRWLQTEWFDMLLSPIGSVTGNDVLRLIERSERSKYESNKRLYKHASGDESM